MIYTNNLMSSIDEVLGSNMFLKDAQQADSLKGNIAGVFGDINANFRSIQNELSSTTNQTFTNLEQIQKTKNALTDFMRNHISACQKFLTDIGEWY